MDFLIFIHFSFLPFFQTLFVTQIVVKMHAWITAKDIKLFFIVPNEFSSFYPFFFVVFAFIFSLDTFLASFIMKFKSNDNAMALNIQLNSKNFHKFVRDVMFTVAFSHFVISAMTRIRNNHLCNRHILTMHSNISKSFCLFISFSICCLCFFPSFFSFFCHTVYVSSNGWYETTKAS